jgi:hypothetical protein
MSSKERRFRDYDRPAKPRNRHKEIEADIDWRELSLVMFPRLSVLYQTFIRLTLPRRRLSLLSNESYEESGLFPS